MPLVCCRNGITSLVVLRWGVCSPHAHLRSRWHFSLIPRRHFAVNAHFMPRKYLAAAAYLRLRLFLQLAFQVALMRTAVIASAGVLLLNSPLVTAIPPGVVRSVSLAGSVCAKRKAAFCSRANCSRLVRAYCLLKHRVFFSYRNGPQNRRPFPPRSSRQKCFQHRPATLLNALITAIYCIVC